MIIGMAAGLQDVVKSDDIALDICVRIGDAVSYTGLCSQVYNDIGLVIPENSIDQGFIRQVALDKCVS